MPRCRGPRGYPRCGPRPSRGGGGVPGRRQNASARQAGYRAIAVRGSRTSRVDSSSIFRADGRGGAFRSGGVESPGEGEGRRHDGVRPRPRPLPPVPRGRDRGGGPPLSAGGGADWERREQEWMGPRPMTTDGLPLIGPLPGRPGVVLAAGHNMLGLMLAPATGRLVTGLLTGKPDDSLPPGFAPGRAVRRGLGPSPGRV
ncbi:NAD(P)/FAD-dependent oxidoreductase [Streptomyces mirabilis]